MAAEGVEKLEDVIVRSAEQVAASIKTAREAIGTIIFGQERVVENALVTILSGGHALLIGVPGLAKTKLVETLGFTLGLDAKRIQFTPDLMPSDILGAEVLDESATGKRSFRFIMGPIFGQLLMADEINRARPRTQSALLQAMQEQHVTIAGARHDLPRPFHVLATQNPLEQEGTYPLPEAQLDRFLLYIKVDYPSGAEEWEIARRVTTGQLGDIQSVISGEDILEMQKLVTRVPVSDQVLGYAWALVRATRPGTKEAPEFVNRWVSWGAGPRGVLTLVTCAKARAILYGRYHATVADVQAVAKPALRHRIAGNYAAQANGLSSEKLIEMLFEAVPHDKKYEKPAA